MKKRAKQIKKVSKKEMKKVKGGKADLSAIEKAQRLLRDGKAGDWETFREN